MHTLRTARRLPGHPFADWRRTGDRRAGRGHRRRLHRIRGGRHLPRLGAEVTVVEALPTPLARVLGEEMGEACGALHRSHGVQLRTGVGVAGVVGRSRGSGTSGRRCSGDASSWSTARASRPTWSWSGSASPPRSSGSTAPGSRSVTAWSATNALFCADRVVAAGDVARWPLASAGRDVRVEHWTNAAEGGAAAARNLLVRPGRGRRPTTLCPSSGRTSTRRRSRCSVSPGPTTKWWWSTARPTRDGWSPSTERGDRLQAALAFSRPRQLMAYRPLLAAGASFDEAWPSPAPEAARVRPARPTAASGSRVIARRRPRRAKRRAKDNGVGDLGGRGLDAAVRVALDHSAHLGQTSGPGRGQPAEARRRSRSASRVSRRGAPRCRPPRPRSTATRWAQVGGRRRRRPTNSTTRRRRRPTQIPIGIQGSRPRRWTALPVSDRPGRRVGQRHLSGGVEVLPSVAGEPHLDPRVGIAGLYLVEVGEGVVGAGHVPHRLAGRDAEAPQHDHGGRRDLLAVAAVGCRRGSS